MKIICNTDILSEACQNVQRAVSTKTSIPAIEGIYMKAAENELTLTDGSDVKLLDSFKLWGEQIFGWYYFVERSVYEPYPDGHGGHYVNKRIKKRLINKVFLTIST